MLDEIKPKKLFMKKYILITIPILLILLFVYFYKFKINFQFSYYPTECGISEVEDSVIWESKNTLIVNKQIGLAGACEFNIIGNYSKSDNNLILKYKATTEGLCYCANLPTMTWKFTNIPKRNYKIYYEEIK